MSLVRRSLIVLAVYVVGAGLLAGVWNFAAPRADCYAPEGECLFFAREMSNIFFVIDSWFAGTAAVLGIACGFALNRIWLSRGFRFQFAGALATIALSYLVSVGVPALNPLESAGAANPDIVTNVISLGAPSALLVWAFFQQLTFAILGPKH